MTPALKRVIVTGASGFVGRHVLAPLVARGFDVHAVSSRAYDPALRGVTAHVVNLQMADDRTEMLERLRPTHLLHFAWYAEPGKFWRATENFDWLDASLSLVRAFQAAGGRRIVLAGTCAEYDWRHGYCVESLTPLVPTTPYGVCKLALSELIASLASITGLSAAWGRIFFLYGPSEHPLRLVPSVATRLLLGEMASVTAGTQIRDFMHVADCAGAFAALLDSVVIGPVNVASGEPIRISAVVTEIARLIGRPELLALGALPLPPTEPPMIVADVARLRHEVGWPQGRALSDGLRSTVDWWRDELDHRTARTDDVS